MLSSGPPLPYNPLASRLTHLQVIPPANLSINPYESYEVQRLPARSSPSACPLYLAPTAYTPICPPTSPPVHSPLRHLVRPPAGRPAHTRSQISGADFLSSYLHAGPPARLSIRPSSCLPTGPPDIPPARSLSRPQPSHRTANHPSRLSTRPLADPPTRPHINSLTLRHKHTTHTHVYKQTHTHIHTNHTQARIHAVTQHACTHVIRSLRHTAHTRARTLICTRTHMQRHTHTYAIYTHIQSNKRKLRTLTHTHTHTHARTQAIMHVHIRTPYAHAHTHTNTNT